MMARSPILFAMLGALTLGVGRADAEPPPIPVPRIHLSWNAPWNEQGAAKNLTPSCSDTTRIDTLYVTFETPPRVMPLSGIAGVLLFEPVAGDTLGPYWDFERG